MTVRRGRALSACALLAIAATACSSKPYGASSSADHPETTPAHTTLRIVESGPSDVKGAGLMLAVDALRREGFGVDVVSVQSFDLVPDVLLRGDGEIGRISSQAAWTAVGKGAALRSIVEANGSWEVVATQAIATCRDLDRKGVSFSTTRGVNMAMFQTFVAANCPGTQPRLVVISHSESRVAALMAGQVDAAQLELQDALQLEQNAPGRFHPLLQAIKDFPQVAVFTYVVREEWAREHPAAVRAFIRAYVAAQRAIIDAPERIRDLAPRLTMDADAAQSLAEAYRARRIWHPNGGLTPEKIGASLAFLSAAHAVPEGLKPDQVADLSHLTAVLDEIGRR